MYRANAAVDEGILIPSKPHFDTASLRRQSWHNWVVLAVTCILCTLGLALTVGISLDRASLWPWAGTGTVLLGALGFLVAVLVQYLTYQQRRMLLLVTSNSDLTEEVTRRQDMERALRLEREQLEQRVAERTSALESQSRRLIELYGVAHEFVGNVSHEFRTPLTVIKAYAGALKDELAEHEDPTVLQHLGAIENRVDDLTVMVDDLLDFNRIEAGILRVSRRTCTLETILSPIWEALERRASVLDIPLQLRIDADLPKIYCDIEKIGRVVINLTMNAFKFSDRGSTVVVWARSEQWNGRVRIGITDHGSGIAPENLKVIFQRFKQVGGHTGSSTKGLGLGLAIVEELVNLNWGKIEVTSQIGSGSSFSFTVPLAEPAALLREYLASGTFRRPPTNVSLVAIHVSEAPELESVGATEVNDFLERQIRRHDLLLRTGPCAWLLGVAGAGDEVTALLVRFQTAHDEANRGRPLRPLPALRFKSLGNWSLADGEADLVTNFVDSVRREARSAESEDMLPTVLVAPRAKTLPTA